MNGLSWEDDGAQEGLLTRRSAQNCLTDCELEEFLFDRLSGVTREVVEEHLLVCERCMDRVEAEESYTATFRQAATRIETEDLTRAMSDEPVASVHGWRDSISAGWSALFRRRTLLAVGGVVAVTAGMFYSPMMRGPAAETAVTLSLARGAAEVAVNAPAGNALRLSADVTELAALPEWQVDVVSGGGALEQSAKVSAVGGRISWQLKNGLAGGRHWVRLRDPRDGSLVREYGLMVR